MEPRSTHARKEYEQGALDEATVARDPIRQFALWYDGAVAAGMDLFSRMAAAAFPASNNLRDVG